jgi:hypothetical protein
MAINKNHLFGELNGVKCAIVESSVSQERVDFLRPLLEHNGYEVIVAPAESPKAAAKPAANEASEPPAVSAPTLFTIGVTDLTFNATNAVFGRMLKTKDGKVVTQAYWLQKEAVNDDETPYYEKQHLFK